MLTVHRVDYPLITRALVSYLGKNLTVPGLAQILGTEMSHARELFNEATAPVLPLYGNDQDDDCA